MINSLQNTKNTVGNLYLESQFDMTSTSYVKVRYAVITAYGSLPDCTALADKLRIGKGIRVVSFQISGGGSTAAAGSAAAGTAAKTTASYSITITAEVHMSRSK